MVVKSYLKNIQQQSGNYKKGGLHHRHTQIHGLI